MREPKQVFSVRLGTQEMDMVGRFGQGSKASQIVEDLNVLYTLNKLGELDLMGRFTKQEAVLLCDVLNGHPFNVSTDIVWGKSGLKSIVRHADLQKSVGSKWNVNIASLLRKVAELTPTEVYVVYCWARRWQNSNTQDQKTAAMLFGCFGDDQQGSSGYVDTDDDDAPF